MPEMALDPERFTLLSARDKKGFRPVPAWPRPDKELPLVQLEVDWVRFSTMNHRTKAEQLRAAHDADQPDLFTAHPLGDIAQSAQYEILKQQDGFAALKADLKERGQQDPAIVTADGILINGNRRSAALRSLYQEDNYLKARYVECLVLPADATKDELVDLEAELQVARDFKEEYSWINEALLIEELFDREGKDFERVAQRMHRQVTDVRAMHEKLQQVHQLVELSKGARLHVDFKDNESAFDELAKHIKNKAPAEANSVRSVYFLGTLANVQYRKLRNLRRDDAAEMVRKEIENDRALKPVLDLAEPPSIASSNSDDLLDDIVGASPAKPSLDGMLALLATKKPEENITVVGGEHVLTQHVLDSLQNAITAAADEAVEERRDQTAVKEPLVRVDKAISELQKAVNALPKARAFSDWDETVMTEKVEAIRSLLSEFGERR